MSIEKTEINQENNLTYVPDLFQLHIPENQPISDDAIEWLVSLGWTPPQVKL